MSILAGVAALVVVPGSAAAADWTPRQTLEPGRYVVSGGVGADARGGAVAAWTRASVLACTLIDLDCGGPARLEYAVRRPGGRFGRPRLLARGGSLEIGVSAGGETLATWRQGNRALVLARLKRGASRFSRPRLVTRDQIGFYDLAVSRRGFAVLCWTTFLGPGRASRTMATTIRPEGRFGPPQRLFQREPSGVGAVSCAINDRGVAAVSVRRGQEVAVSDRRGRFGRSLEVPGVVSPSARPSLAVTPRGGVVVVANGTREAPTVSIAVKRPGRGFGLPRTLTTRGNFAAEVAVDGRGRPLVVWSEQGVEGNRPGIVVAEGRRDGALAPPRLISPPGAGFPALAVAPDGTATVLWTEGLIGRPGPVTLRLVGARRDRRGEWRAQRLPARPHDSGVFLPELAMAETGEAVALWTDEDARGVFGSTLPVPKR